MAEEEKNEQETTEPEATEEEAAPQAAGEQPEEPAAEEEAQEAEAVEEKEVPVAEQEQADPSVPGVEDEEADGGDSPASQEEAAEGAAEAAEGDADSQAMHPRQIRKLARSRASGPPGPQRSSEERARTRSERREAAAESRRRHRAARRRKRGEPGSGTPPAPREPGPKKVRQGRVVSAAADKTITVEIAVVRRHATYEKVVRRTSKLRAHDESNQAQEGDVVRVVEARPLSRTKRWRLLEVVEKAR